MYKIKHATGEKADWDWENYEQCPSDALFILEQPYS